MIKEETKPKRKNKSRLVTVSMIKEETKTKRKNKIRLVELAHNQELSHKSPTAISSRIPPVNHNSDLMSSKSLLPQNNAIKA